MSRREQKNDKMRIALDAMGGDHAPAEVVRGAVESAKEHKIEVVLVGQQEAIRSQLDLYGQTGLALSIVDASQVVEMGDHPAMAIRQKRDSSIVVGMNLLKEGSVSAFVSAGNSGALMTAALLVLGRIEQIERPAIGTVFPTLSGKAFLLDVGANADCRPMHLVQFAHMGSLYMEKVFGIEKPRVALLSNGEEETKGNQLVQEAHRLLKMSDLNFIGNVEGKDIPKGVADVVVCDGFTGNVVTKVTEGLSEMLFESLRQALTRQLHFKVAASILRPAFSDVKKQLDYTEYGGAPLLGVDGVVIVAHGRSDAKAIKNALRVAKQAVEQNMLAALKLKVAN